MISIVKPYIPPKEVLMPALEKTIYSGYIAQGEKVEDFEFKLGQYFENNNLLTVNSGTSALHLSLILANVGPGDEVISTALTAEPTNTAIAQTGAKVIWADTESFTGLICPKSVEKLITNKQVDINFITKNNDNALLLLVNSRQWNLVEILLKNPIVDKYHRNRLNAYEILKYWNIHFFLPYFSN